MIYIKILIEYFKMKNTILAYQIILGMKIDSTTGRVRPKPVIESTGRLFVDLVNWVEIRIGS